MSPTYGLILRWVCCRNATSPLSQLGPLLRAPAPPAVCPSRALFQASRGVLSLSRFMHGTVRVFLTDCHVDLAAIIRVPRVRLADAL